jgi:DNA-binding IclR family transcriptional regulator
VLIQYNCRLPEQLIAGKAVRLSEVNQITTVGRRKRNGRKLLASGSREIDSIPEGSNRSVARALGILVDIAQSERPQSFAEFHKRLKLPKATLHKLLFTLESLGFVFRSADSNRYSLGLAALELSAGGPSRHGDIRGVIYPFLKTLVDQYNEIGHIGVLDGTEEVLLERIDPPDQVVRIAIGRRHPAYGSSGGLASLAARGEAALAELPEQLKPMTKNTVKTRKQLVKRLEEIRTRGYAIEMEEVYTGVRCVGVAIDVPGWPVASISFSLPVQRGSVGRLEELSAPLVEAAKKIERILAVTPRM